MHSRNLTKTSNIPRTVVSGLPAFWLNQKRRDAKPALNNHAITVDQLTAAVQNMHSFEPLLAALFPETAANMGKIKSTLIELDADTAFSLIKHPGHRVLVKCDHDLPITGSIKARGGMYEILNHATKLAIHAGLIKQDESPIALASVKAKTFFSQHKLVVGSTGNLGFSIGVIGRRLGFDVEVHMSHDAKKWKKQRLTDLGVNVVEHAKDYSHAVAAARDSSESSSTNYFIDDEHSLDLFLGYSLAAQELAEQLTQAGIVVDKDYPLEVYLPCGVGGAPGGVCFGLKHIYADAVRCIFVEPVASPCMLVQLVSGLKQAVNVYDCGLSNQTAADGLAVAQASLLVAEAMEFLLDGIVTVDDETLYYWVEKLYRNAGLKLEPSAAAGFAALSTHVSSLVGDGDTKTTRVVWTTGGAMLPDLEFEAILRRGEMTGTTS